MIANNKTSFLINTQVPEFVRSDHATFVEFLKAYYAFMEQESGVLNIARNFENYHDVDLADGVFLQELYDTFISVLPDNILADKKLILKHVKDFYRARGSEKATRFLLRILLNKEIEFYYPKRDVLRVSDGKWYIQKSIRLNDIAVDNTSNSVAHTNFVNKTVTGLTSGATATVEQVDRYYDQNQLITELQLSGEYRSFINGETIFCLFDENSETKYLSANLLSGIITSVALSNGGYGYAEGSYVPVEGGGGTGAQVVISSVSKGAIASIGIAATGAGFQNNDTIIITGDGTGATAIVGEVDTSGLVHPNSYNIINSIISLEAGTTIGNAKYSNLVSSVADPANAWITNSMYFWTYSNCGPLKSCTVVLGGNNYKNPPTMDVQANTIIRSLGTLGKLTIVNGGLNYQVNDQLVFTNPYGCFGVGAAAKVTSVDGSGTITGVQFYQMTGHLVGGAGYDSMNLPTVTVSSVSGAGADIRVTAVLGDNESLLSSSSPVGQILELTLVSGGSGYTTEPTINLANMSSGSGGVATATYTTGAFTYPGRFLNDDGFLSAYNFLQDRDFYQNFSYVIRVDESLNKYRKAIRDLLHPAGMKLFGDYIFTDYSTTKVNVNVATTMSNSLMKLVPYNTIISDVIYTGQYYVYSPTATYAPQIVRARYNVSPTNTTTYMSYANTLTIYRPSDRFEKGTQVYLQFDTNTYPNVINGVYTVSHSNSTHLVVPVANGNVSIYQPGNVRSNLTLTTGAGGTLNSYVTLTHWPSNSNVSVAVGDSINVGSNVVSVVNITSGSTLIRVSPGLTSNLIANVFSVKKRAYYPSGNVKVYNPKITIYANNHGLVPGDEAYFKFLSADTSLANTSYNVYTANSTQLTVWHKDIVNVSSFSGNVNVQTALLTITSNYHGLDDGDQVVVKFFTGDTANATNGLYTIRNSTQNTFNVLTGHSVVTGGSAYLLTPNITLNIANHGFSSNDNVRVWFTSGDTANIANGDYTVTVRNSNQVFFEVPDFVYANGNVSVYRGYSNVIINKSSHGYVAGDNVNFLMETGNTARISNGVFTVVASNTNYFTIKHDSINVSSNVINLLPNNTGTAYVSKR